MFRNMARSKQINNEIQLLPRPQFKQLLNQLMKKSELSNMIRITLVKENWFYPAKYTALKRITKLIEYRQ